MTTVNEGKVTRLNPDMAGKYRVIVTLDNGEGLMLKYDQAPVLSAIQGHVDSYETVKAGEAERVEQATVARIRQEMDEYKVLQVLASEGVLEQMTAVAIEADLQTREIIDDLK